MLYHAIELTPYHCDQHKWAYSRNHLYNHHRLFDLNQEKTQNKKMQTKSNPQKNPPERKQQKQINKGETKQKKQSKNAPEKRKQKSMREGEQKKKEKTAEK